MYRIKRKNASKFTCTTFFVRLFLLLFLSLFFFFLMYSIRFFFTTSSSLLLLSYHCYIVCIEMFRAFFLPSVINTRLMYQQKCLFYKISTYKLCEEKWHTDRTKRTNKICIRDISAVTVCNQSLMVCAHTHLVAAVFSIQQQHQQQRRDRINAERSTCALYMLLCYSSHANVNPCKGRIKNKTMREIHAHALERANTRVHFKVKHSHTLNIWAPPKRKLASHHP